jgi:hypothetical protein
MTFLLCGGSCVCDTDLLRVKEELASFFLGPEKAVEKASD